MDALKDWVGERVQQLWGAAQCDCRGERWAALCCAVPVDVLCLVAQRQWAHLHREFCNTWAHAVLTLRCAAL